MLLVILIIIPYSQNNFCNNIKVVPSFNLLHAKTADEPSFQCKNLILFLNLPFINRLTISSNTLVVTYLFYNCWSQLIFWWFFHIYHFCTYYFISFPTNTFSFRKAFNNNALKFHLFYYTKWMICHNHKFSNYSI